MKEKEIEITVKKKTNGTKSETTIHEFGIDKIKETPYYGHIYSAYGMPCVTFKSAN